MAAFVVKEMVLGRRLFLAIVTKDVRNKLFILCRHGLALQVLVEAIKVFRHVAQRLETSGALV